MQRVSAPFTVFLSSSQSHHSVRLCKRVAHSLSLQLQVVGNIDAIHVHAISDQIDYRGPNLVGYE